MAGTTDCRADRRGSNGTRAVIPLSIAALCALLALPAAVAAQGSTTATVRGTIQDPTGGVVPGASVTITNVGTKGVNTTVTDDRGQYLFAGLFPGTYHLKVELSGFK